MNTDSFRFARKGLLLATLVIATLTLGFLLAPSSPHKYVNAVIDKHDRLVHTRGPKLILVGGSNLAFGIDSERLEHAFGYRVVNTGVHAGFGLPFMLALVEPHVQAGDLVVVAAGYKQYDGQWQHRALSEALAEFPAGLSYARLTSLDPMIFWSAAQRRFRRAMRLQSAWPPPIYDREGFNAYGDLVTHLRASAPDTLRGMQREKPDRAHPDVVALLNAFHQHCERRGARVVITFPPLPRDLVDHNGFWHDADAWAADLNTRTASAVISRPRTYFLPRADFFDTVGHLNATGRQRRTTRLIEDLRTAGVPSPSRTITAGAATTVAHHPSSLRRTP